MEDLKKKLIFRIYNSTQSNHKISIDEFINIFNQLEDLYNNNLFSQNYFEDTVTDSTIILDTNSQTISKSKSLSSEDLNIKNEYQLNISKNNSIIKNNSTNLSDSNYFSDLTDKNSFESSISLNLTKCSKSTDNSNSFNNLELINNLEPINNLELINNLDNQTNKSVFILNKESKKIKKKKNTKNKNFKRNNKCQLNPYEKTIGVDSLSDYHETFKNSNLSLSESDNNVSISTVDSIYDNDKNKVNNFISSVDSLLLSDKILDLNENLDVNPTRKINILINPLTKLNVNIEVDIKNLIKIEII